MTTQVRRRAWTHERQADGKDPEVAHEPHAILAEDDFEMRQLLAHALRMDGYRVTEVRDGSELLDAMAGYLIRGKGGSLDLVVTDVRMPKIGGLEAIAGLRQCDWSTPVVVITAFGDEETHAEARRLGAIAVFDKPFDLRAIRSSWRGLA